MKFQPLLLSMFYTHTLQCTRIELERRMGWYGLASNSVCMQERESGWDGRIARICEFLAALGIHPPWHCELNLRICSAPNRHLPHEEDEEHSNFHHLH